LALEPFPLGGRIAGQALIERRHHHDGAARSQRATEGGGYGQAPLGVDPMAISAFEHSELAVFHTLFHFSTPARETAQPRWRNPSKASMMRGSHIPTLAS